MRLVEVRSTLAVKKAKRKNAKSVQETIEICEEVNLKTKSLEYTTKTVSVVIFIYPSVVRISRFKSGLAKLGSVTGARMVLATSPSANKSNR